MVLAPTAEGMGSHLPGSKGTCAWGRGAEKAGEEEPRTVIAHSHTHMYMHSHAGIHLQTHWDTRTHKAHTHTCTHRHTGTPSQLTLMHPHRHTLTHMEHFERCRRWADQAAPG